MTIGITITILASCLLLEAFFSGAELALIAADRVQLRTRAESAKPSRRRRIERFLNDPGQLISTSLTGTNICVVLSTVTATVSLLPRYPHQAELISLGLMAPLVLVFGEIVPKSIFQHYADRVALPLIDALSALRVLFFPFVLLGSKVSAALLRMLKLERKHTEMTREELRLLISLPSRQGEDRITADERQMITRLFDFSDMSVEDVMVPLSEVTAVPHTSTLEDVAREIDEKRHTRLPVYRERIDQIEGIVHAFDVLRAEHGAELSQIMRPAIFVPENQPAVDTLVRLQREGQHMAVVVDEYGGAIGVTTIDDVLEEIVGEIRDEFDADASELIRREEGGAFRVLARTDVERVNAVTRLGLPESDDYESVAGLLLDRLKRIPRRGEHVDIDGVRLTVTRASERAVDEVRIERKRPRG